MAKILDDYSPFWRKMMKKIQGKPQAVQTLQRRSMNSAIAILDNIKGIDFSKLSMSLYFYCQDVQMAQFTHLYESQIELAGANPEKFFVNLHSFYNEVSNKIKKNNLYQDFFEFYYRCVRIRQQNENKNIEDKVLIAYLNLLTQNIEYLRPNKFDFSSCVCGLSTKGEVLITKDLFPTIDQPSYELREKAEKGEVYDTNDIFKTYAKYGYDIKTIEDLHVVTNIDKIQTTTIDALLPFINEYTFDIIPQTPFSAYVLTLDVINTTIDLPTLKEKLTKRKRTLSTNGVEVHFRNSPFIQDLLLKEILFDNRIFMLYRLTTKEGDLCGYYDTKGQFLYSILNEYQDDPNLVKKLASLILYCYASFTLNDIYQLADFKKFFTIKDCPFIYAEGFLKGGKLNNVYKSSDEDEEHTGTARIGSDDYEKDTRAIQGFIRRLPNGQKASMEAIEYAEALGYSLESNETFVRPFIKQVFKLKIKNEE